MAESALTSDPGDPLERYGSIEKAYCDDRWTTVIQDGQSLLSDLSGEGQPAPEGLQQRLQLLMAHAYLYGLGDRDSAEDLYQAVLHSGAESSLRQIAEQGLQQCALPVAAAPELEDDDEPQPTGSATQPIAESPLSAEQAFWGADQPTAPAALDAAAMSAGESGDPPSPESGSWAEPSPQSPAAALSWLGGVASSTAQPAPAGGGSPVMPWLASDPDAAGAPTSMEPPDQAGSEAAWPNAVGPDPVADAGDTGQLPRQPAQVDQSSASDALQAAAAVAEAALEAEARSAPGWQPQDLQAERSDPVVEELPAPMPLERTPELELSAINPEPSSVALPAEQPLVPEVVEEPELIELHQADVLRREEVELSVRESLPAAPQASRPDLSAAAVRPQLERRGAQPVVDPIEDRRSQEPAEPEPVLEQDVPLTAVAPLPRPVPVGIGAAAGPFSVPPEAMAEEDPEMLMGLLKVEMG